MKKIHLFGCVILSVILAAGCGSHSESSSKARKKASKTTTKSEKLEDEEPTESPKKSEATTKSRVIEENSELIPPDSIMQELIEKLDAWQMPYSYGLYDESLHIDDILSCDARQDDGNMFKLEYTYFAEPEDAKTVFDSDVNNGQVYGVVDKKADTDGPPRICVWWGSYQRNESDPVMQDIYVMVQFEREYLFAYGRGEVEAQRVLKLMQELDIEIPT